MSDDLITSVSNRVLDGTSRTSIFREYEKADECSENVLSLGKTMTCNNVLILL